MARNLQFPPSVKPGIPKLGKKPDGWSKVTFSEVLEVVQRPADLDDDAEYQLVVAKRNRGGIAPRERLRGGDIRTKTQFYVRRGDFLISRRQIVHGACGIVPPELDGAVVSNEYTVLHARNALNLEYLEYYTHSLHFQQTCFHSSVGVAVEKMIFKLDDWLHHPVYLPPSRIQNRIVAILKAWDTAIERMEKLIEAKRRLKQGLMQQLLTGKRRFPEFSGKWKRFSFGEIATLGRKRHDPRQSNESLPCVELEYIAQVDGRLFATIDSREQRSTKAVFRKGDVLFGKLRPNLRKYLHCSFDGVCSTEIWVLRANTTICCSDYLFRLVQTERFISTACTTTGSKMPRADWTWVSQQVFRVPTLPEQKKIAAVLNAADREIAALCRLVDQFRHQKRGLMQKLLTGKVRVKV